MLDPISIITITAFAMQAIEFVINSGIKVYTYGQQISEVERQLWIFWGKLAKCEASLERWKTVWGRYSDETYIHFWGKDEFNNVQKLLNIILQYASSIKSQVTGQEIEAEANGNKGLLHKLKVWKRGDKGQNGGSSTSVDSNSRHALSSEDISAWRKVIQQIGSGDTNVPIKVAKPGLARRIAFNLAESNLIQEQISRLEELIGELDFFTREYFRKRRGMKSEVDEPVKREETQKVEKLKTAVDGLSAFASALHESYKRLQHQSPWSLELRDPDQKGSAALFDSVSKLDIDVTLCLTADGKGGPWRRVRIGYFPIPTHEGATLAASLPRSMLQPVTITAPKLSPLCSVQPPLQRRSIVFRPLLRNGIFDLPATLKAWEQDRARLLLGLTNWTILMWHSPWTAVPCCCGIRFLQMPDGTRQYTLAAEEHNDCRNASLAEYKLLLLGMAIAELLTGWSLRLPPQHQPGRHGSANYECATYFERWERQSRWPAWEPCMQARLLAEVKDKSLKAGLVTVLEYCFDYSAETLAVHKSPDVLPCLVENVLNP